MTKPLKIFYVTNARIPTEKAHGLATVKMCEAFAKKGAEVTLFVPWRINPVSEDPYEYYAAERVFKIKTLPSIDMLWLGFGKQFFFAVQVLSFSLAAAFWLLARYGLRGAPKDTVIFSHDYIPLYFASFASTRIFYDIHDYPQKNSVYERVLKKSIGLSVQTKRKIDAVYNDFGVPREKIVYWPNGVDVKRFDIPLSQGEARKKLNLPQDKKIVLYTGQLFPGRGVHTLVEAAQFLPKDVLVYIVGGSKGEIEKFQIPNSKFQIRFVGQRPWTEMPLWLKAADVLVAPHSARAHAVGRAEVSLYYISPMKLFEYMASGRPIVASDIPSIREIVDESMVFFAEPDNPESFASVIQTVLSSPEDAKRRSENARREVQNYTWEDRAEKILLRMREVF